MIRNAGQTDVDAIVALWNDVIRNTTFTFTKKLKTSDEIAAMIANPAHLMRVVLQDGKFAGVALVTPFRSGPGYGDVVEHTIYLQPEAQGTGLGRRLITDLLDAAAKRGTFASIAAVSGSNPGAIAFHQAMGFTQVGRLPKVGQKFGERLDLVLMQKTLVGPTDIPGQAAYI